MEGHFFVHEIQVDLYTLHIRDTKLTLLAM